MTSRSIVLAGRSKGHFTDMVAWLNDRGLKPVDDFDYLGDQKGKDAFAFDDRDTAMLFKLTWGGD